MERYKLKAELDWSPASTRLIVTPSLPAKSMFYYVQEIGHLRAGPQYYTEREHLHSFLIVHTLSGSGTLEYRGQTYAVRPGQTFFIDCMDYQHYYTSRTGSWELLFVHFNGSASRSYFDHFMRDGTPLCDVASVSPISELIRRLIETHQTKDVRTEYIASALLVNLLTELSLYKLRGNSEETSRFLPSYLEEIVQHLNRCFQERITMDTLAGRFAVSKFYLAREFKRYMGIAPIEYVIRNRITAAKELLQFTDQPVAQIAEQVGFDHVSHFINMFKKQEQLTPLAFRKKWRGN
ncbi:helix-turn-helix transcriptional regulator [Paenibacillus hamazuiensis]|uniref:helix-turn-helix transcriptional regulator n=1 Tax=Paenibacillus hamazuiensis TaxID=2936508 RepID=UPI00200C5EEB|nr:AraC family transcriptional regulator [Paenibacillus hamazuiensis]